MAELNQASVPAGRRARRLSARVDLTAMVDLAFLLVTFFMLTTRLDKPRAMPLAMPDNQGESHVPASRTLTLCRGSNNQVLWYRGTISKPLDGPAVVNYGPAGLRHVILNMMTQVKKESNKDMIVLLKPSSRANYGNVINTIDELNIAQANTYAITDITSPDIALLQQKKAY